MATHWMRGWMSLRKGLDALAKKNIAVPAGDTISVSELKVMASVYREQLTVSTIYFHE
jgi:hypothetical protein